MVYMRLDIAFAVGVLSRHVASPGNVHMLAVKHVFRYLHGTSKYRLVFCVNDSIDSPPIAYVDSDWAGDWTDRKSISGYTILLDGGAISWGSKKQSSMSLSTVKVELSYQPIPVTGIKPTVPFIARACYPKSFWSL